MSTVSTIIILAFPVFGFDVPTLQHLTIAARQPLKTSTASPGDLNKGINIVVYHLDIYVSIPNYPKPPNYEYFSLRALYKDWRAWKTYIGSDSIPGNGKLIMRLLNTVIYLLVTGEGHRLMVDHLLYTHTHIVYKIIQDGTFKWYLHTVYQAQCSALQRHTQINTACAKSHASK